MKNIFYTRILLVLLIALLSVNNSAQAQCAMCRATVEANNQNKESEVGKGLNTGILYLMTIPYLLVGTVGFLFYRYQKKAKAQTAARKNRNSVI